MLEFLPELSICTVPEIYLSSPLFVYRGCFWNLKHIWLSFIEIIMNFINHCVNLSWVKCARVCFHQKHWVRRNLKITQPHTMEGRRGKGLMTTSHKHQPPWYQMFDLKHSQWLDQSHGNKKIAVMQKWWKAYTRGGTIIILCLKVWSSLRKRRDRSKKGKYRRKYCWSN